MKVAVVLLLVAVGACSAAFTGSLVQQTRPALNRASLQASVASRALAHGDKDISEFLQGIVDHAINQAQALIEHIQAAAQAVGGHVSNLSIIVKAQIRAAIAALRTVAAQISSAAGAAQSALHARIQALISSLQALLDGNSSEDSARQLLAQLNLPALLENAIQNVLAHLSNNPFIAHLIEQVTPFLDQAGNIIQQVTDLILGNTKLSPAAPRGLFDQLQNILATIQSIVGSAIESAHAAAQQLIAQAIAHGQATAEAAAQHVLEQVQTLAPFLGSLGPSLIEALQNLIN